MSSGKFIDFQLGMKYDLSNSIKSSLIEGFNEFKKQQKIIRNFLLMNNNKEREKENQINSQIKIFKIFNFKKKHLITEYLYLSEENNTPGGYFCYPMKGAFFQKSCLEMPFFPILPFNKFKEAIETFSDQINLSETYQSYPCLPKNEFNRVKNKIIKNNIIYKKQPIFNNIKSETKIIPIRPSHCTNNINKHFIIWSFIKIVKGQIIIMDKDFNKIYENDKNNIIIPIIKEMNKHLKIDINILYYIIIKFINDLIKKINRDSLSKKGIRYKKYDKYWCRICNKFCCAFHFKIKVKPKTLDNNNIRTYIEYFKKIQIILKSPEYLYREEEESDKQKKTLNSTIEGLIRSCKCKNDNNNSKNSHNLILELDDDNENSPSGNDQIVTTDNNNNDFDDSVRFNKMVEIYDKEDLFVLCKVVKTCHKLLNQNFFGLYGKEEAINHYLHPCVLRKILHDKYDCSLLKYLLKLIIDEKYLRDINFFLGSTNMGNAIKYEKLTEDNYLFFNNTIETNIPTQKINDKGEQQLEITNFRRTKATARLQVQSDKNLYYKPCDHYPLECTMENCSCAKRGMCLKYCCCYKEKLLDKEEVCRFMFLGCNHTKSKQAKCIDCICKKFSIECVPGLCKCGEKCCNNNITLGKRKKLLFGYSVKINGGGLFAGEKIYEGEFVDSYDGEIVEKEELDRLSVFYDQTGNNYPFSINDKFDYVTIKTGGLTRYINHASYGDENIKADKIMVNGIPYIAFYANRNIEQYEELFYDYSYDKESMPEWMKEYNKMMERKRQLDILKVPHQKSSNKKQYLKQKNSTAIKRNYEKNEDIENDRENLQLYRGINNIKNSHLIQLQEDKFK